MSTNNGSTRSSRRSKRLALNTNQKDEGETAVVNTPWKNMKVVGDAEMGEVAAYVKKHQSTVLMVDAKLDILLSQAKLCHEHYVKQKLCSTGWKLSRAEATNHVVAYLLWKKEAVGEVWSNYVNVKPLQVTNPAGNYCRKSSCAPRVPGVIAMVQRFLRDQQITRTQMVLKDVMDFLDGCGFITVNRQNKMSAKSALWSVHIEQTGYKRGKRKGIMYNLLKEENIWKQDAYVQWMMEANNYMSRQIVYMDESYIHKNYHQHDNSIFDPNDEQDLETKPKKRASTIDSSQKSLMMINVWKWWGFLRRFDLQ